jgi:hypothetical protein
MKTPDQTKKAISPEKTGPNVFDQAKYDEYTKDYKTMVENLEKAVKEAPHVPGAGDFHDDTPEHRLEDAITESSVKIESDNISLARAVWDLFWKDTEKHGNLFITEHFSNEGYGRLSEEMKEYLASKIDIQSAGERVIDEIKEGRPKGGLYPEKVVQGLEIMISKSSQKAGEILQKKLEEYKDIMEKNNISINE